MSVLNIFDAVGNANTGWNSTEKLNESAISQLKDKSAKTTNALNAIPSPFSRLHTFETAFKMVARDILEDKDRASAIYKELVSDCLDAIELVFNANFHESQGNKLVFTNWNAEDLTSLSSGNTGQRVLSKTLKMFLTQDFETENFKISLVKYKGLVIAGSSPFTLLFTTPNLDKSHSTKAEERFKSSKYSQTFDLNNPSSGHIYFTKYIPFSKRSNSFKSYLISLFETNTVLKGGRTKPFWDYLEAEGAGQVIVKNVPTTKNRSGNGGVFGVEHVALESNSEASALDIFNDHIIRVGYLFNDLCFHLPKYVNDKPERKWDYLLPVKEDFFKTFDPKEINRCFTYEEVGENRIKVSYNDGRMDKPNIKYFLTAGNNKTEGRIIQVGKDLDYTFLLGIFPFLKVLNADGSIHADYNDSFHVSLSVDAPSNYSSLKTDSFKLDFFKKNGFDIDHIAEDGENYSSIREVRRSFESPDLFASIYYHLKNTSFDFLKINLQKTTELDAIHGLLIPRWKEKFVGDKQFDFSVDFGTTNTFIAYTDDPNHNSMPKPFDMTINDLQMVMLEKPAEKKEGQSVSSSFAKGKTKNIISSVVYNEFVPPVFLPNEPSSSFNMPFRTAVYQKKNAIKFKLFSDLNVHFGYQKTEIDSTASESQEIVANLKWNISSPTDLGSKQRVEIFIQELCLLFKYKVLLNDGNPKLTKLNWFIPQSLSEGSIKAYDDIWKEKVAGYLKSAAPPKRVYESEAPYYFLERTAQIENSESVLSIDIGGGSTDAMLFVNKLPRLGTSFNFAGNVLWSNGYNQLTNDAKENGFYTKINNLLTSEIEANPFFKSSKLHYESKSTDDIVNFWLANSDQLKIIDHLKSPDFKIVYLFHYCAVIFHLAQLLKSNNYSEPTCVIFSGNGSKYIDFIGSNEVLSEITSFIISKVFKKEIKSPQIILPAKDRKEATCYGGIFKKGDEKFTSKSYLGTELEFAKSNMVDTYADIENNITNIKPSIKKNINGLLDIFEGLNEIVNFKAQLSIDFNIGSIRNYIESQLDSNFEKGYGIRKEKISYDEKVTDSLFFYPLAGVIFELGRLTKEKLTEYTPQLKVYSDTPSDDNVFDISDITTDKAFNSVYQISIPVTNPNEARFSIINEEGIFQRAYSTREFTLKPVCDFVNYPDEGKIVIKQHNAGRLRKDGNQWIVTEKLKIEFI